MAESGRRNDGVGFRLRLVRRAKAEKYRLVGEEWLAADELDELFNTGEVPKFAGASRARRLSADEVRLLRRLESCGASLAVLARRFGLAKTTVHKICRGHSYRDVPGFFRNGVDRLGEREVHCARQLRD